jgi:hypothetical protein
MSRILKICEIPWPPSIRVAIVDHLIYFDINISLLIDPVQNYRFNLERIEELVEIVIAFNILRAEERLREYEVLLLIRLREIEIKEKNWERKCCERLPVNFFVHVGKLRNNSSARLLGRIILFSGS